MINSDETTWFLCAEDFAVQSDEGFQWNEWEIVGLGSAEDDEEWKPLRHRLRILWKK